MHNVSASNFLTNQIRRKFCIVVRLFVETSPLLCTVAVL